MVVNPVSVRKEFHFVLSILTFLFCQLKKSSWFEIKLSSKFLTLNPFRPFEIFIYLAIFANCVSLAMYKPMPKSDVDETSSVLVSQLFL